MHSPTQDRSCPQAHGSTFRSGICLTGCSVSSRKYFNSLRIARPTLLKGGASPLAYSPVAVHQHCFKDSKPQTSQQRATQLTNIQHITDSSCSQIAAGGIGKLLIFWRLHSTGLMGDSVQEHSACFMLEPKHTRSTPEAHLKHTRSTPVPFLAVF